jgi:hypothetical protein
MWSRGSDQRESAVTLIPSNSTTCALTVDHHGPLHNTPRASSLNSGGSYDAMTGTSAKSKHWITGAQMKDSVAHFFFVRCLPLLGGRGLSWTVASLLFCAVLGNFFTGQCRVFLCVHPRSLVSISRTHVFHSFIWMGVSRFHLFFGVLSRTPSIHLF